MVSEREVSQFFKGPIIANGGMAVDVSNGVAKEVAKVGLELGINTIGVLASTGLGPVTSRKLQDGDLLGELREAFDEFPNHEMAERVWKYHFIKGGRKGAPYKPTDMVNPKPSRRAQELLILANFERVWTAKKDHKGKIFVNYMAETETALLASILGGMYGGMDGAFVGAGFPDLIPGVMARFANYEPAIYPLTVDGRRSAEFTMSLNPAAFVPEKMLKNGLPPKPKFGAIVSSYDMVELLITKGMATGNVDAIIVENYTGGGHTARPRGNKKTYNDRGEYAYKDRDSAKYQEIAEFGVPSLWAGSYADSLKEVVDNGGAGISIGTLFALSRESYLREDIKDLLIEWAVEGKLDIFADPRCSPTGYPFNVVQVPKSMSDSKYYEEFFDPKCEFGYLRKAFRDPKDPEKLIMRCYAESEKTYLDKGGRLEDMIGRRCVCKGLLAAAGLDDGMFIATLGKDIESLKELIAIFGRRFTVRNVIQWAARDFLPIAA